mgnify:CR=1 FL=1
MNLPNKLTMMRVIMVPFFMVFAAMSHMGTPQFNATYALIAGILFAVASFTDFLDGYLARKNHLVTDFGKFMDPLADKMLVLAAMCIFIERGQMPAWCVAIVLFREFAVSGLRLIAVEQSRVIAAARSGKIKTGCTMVGLGAMLVFGQQYPVVNLVCYILIIVTTVYSGVEYFVANRDVFKAHS